MFNWALEGLKMLLKDGQFEDWGSVMDIKRMYKEHADIVYAFFHKFYEHIPNTIIDKMEYNDRTLAVPTEEMKDAFTFYLKEIQKQSDSSLLLNLKLLDGKSFSDDTGKIDFDNFLVQPYLEQLLGKGLHTMGIRHRRLRDKERDKDEGNRQYYYVGVRRKYTTKEMGDMMETE